MDTYPSVPTLRDRELDREPYTIRHRYYQHPVYSDLVKCSWSGRVERRSSCRFSLHAGPAFDDMNGNALGPFDGPQHEL